MSRKEEIKELFTFTKGERRGITVLIIILIGVLLLNFFYDSLFIKRNVDYSVFEREIAEFEKGLIPLNENQLNINLQKQYDTINLFNFDPNKTSKKEFLQLGLSEKQINNIYKYISKGGKFFKKSDFKKIYSISSEQFEILYPYIDLPDDYQAINSSSRYSENNKDIDNLNKRELFDFDPNFISDSEWSGLGFSEKQVSVIRNYINKGGKFYKKEDLKNVYVISEKKYKEIEEFININKETIKEAPDNNSLKDLKSIDINNFSINDFNELGGSWKYYSSRIVKYRNLLGGYCKKEQLREVYGFNDDFYQKNSDFILVDLSKIKQININFAEISDLISHPYLSDSDSKNIINFRNKNGAYKDLLQLKDNNIISVHIYNKVYPYLKVK